MTYCIRILLPPSPLFHTEKLSVVKSFKLTRKFQQISGFLLNTSEKYIFSQNIFFGGGGATAPSAPPPATALKRYEERLLWCPNMSIILCMSSCFVLVAYFLSMLITAILLIRSCPIVDLKNVLMRRRTLKDLSQSIARGCRNCGQNGGNFI